MNFYFYREFQRSSAVHMDNSNAPLANRSSSQITSTGLIVTNISSLKLKIMKDKQ